MKIEDVCPNHPYVDTSCDRWQWVVSVVFNERYDNWTKTDLLRFLKDTVSGFTCPLS